MSRADATRVRLRSRRRLIRVSASTSFVPYSPADVRPRRRRWAGSAVDGDPRAVVYKPVETFEKQDGRVPDGFHDVISRGAVRSVFQPIVDLLSGHIVGYEALARGPVGPWERPDVLFAAARALGRLQELDELCRRSAVADAMQAHIYAPLTLFLNVEPDALRLEALQQLVDTVSGSTQPLQLVLELTERALAADPAKIVATVHRLRAAGWRIAMDDVGVDNMSLTFMSLLRPDVVKIDMGVVQRQPDAAVAALMNAINAQAERTGCLLLAEGIETDAHEAAALALGAQLGQGYKFGRPGPIANASGQLTNQVVQTPVTLPLTVSAPESGAGSPLVFDRLPAGMKKRTSTKPLLIEVSKHLERQAATLGNTAIVIGTFQQAQHFTASTARRYRKMAANLGFVAAIAVGLPDEPAPGVRGATLDEADPLGQEWDVVVLSPHFAAALIAREETNPKYTDRERTFEFVLTYDRTIVENAAQALTSRISPKPSI